MLSSGTVSYWLQQPALQSLINTRIVLAIHLAAEVDLPRKYTGCCLPSQCYHLLTYDRLHVHRSAELLCYTAPSPLQESSAKTRTDEDLAARETLMEKDSVAYRNPRWSRGSADKTHTTQSPD